MLIQMKLIEGGDSLRPLSIIYRLVGCSFGLLALWLCFQFYPLAYYEDFCFAGVLFLLSSYLYFVGRRYQHHVNTSTLPVTQVSKKQLEDEVLTIFLARHKNK